MSDVYVVVFTVDRPVEGEMTVWLDDVPIDIQLMLNLLHLVCSLLCVVIGLLQLGLHLMHLLLQLLVGGVLRLLSGLGVLWGLVMGLWLVQESGPGVPRVVVRMQPPTHDFDCVEKL